MESFEYSDFERAEIDARVIELLARRSLDNTHNTPNLTTSDYDQAADYLTNIKHTLSSFTDEQIIDDFDWVNLFIEKGKDSSEIMDKSILYDDTLYVSTQLDLERAIRLHEMILSREDLQELTCISASFSLERLTYAAGERTIPLWKAALSHPGQTVQYASYFTLERMLDKLHDTSDLSTSLAEKLIVLAHKIDPDWREITPD